MNNDVGVAIIFFNRPYAVKQVFDAVAIAKPARLFLIQDGPRNVLDVPKIEECRKVFEDIDWDCEVKTNYSDENLGCGKRMSSGISWMFEYVEKGIILEDDCVPSPSFFDFCYEVLERYKDDERISYISGMNHWGEYSNNNADYLFALNGAIWGWATWKRSWRLFDYSVDAIKDRNIIDYIKSVEPKHVAENDIKKWQETNAKVTRGEKISYWAHQWRLVKFINSSLCIIPSKNLIKNVGDRDATHPVVGECSFHNLDVNEFDTPVVHPTYVIRDYEYDTLYYKEFEPSFKDRVIKRIKRVLRVGK